MSLEFRAVILAGGKGTRLRPYTVTLPKPLVPVGERPILDIVLGQLRTVGVTRVTLAVNHMAQLLMAYFGKGENYGMPIDYALESQPLGTVGPLRGIPDLPDHFLVMNGDILTDLDYRALWDAHLQSGAIATIGSFSRTSLIDFGVLSASDDGLLIGFQEKPRFQHLVSMGVHVFSRRVLDYIPVGRAFGFDDLMLALIDAGEPVRCYVHTGLWLDIGRAEDYANAQDLVLAHPGPFGGAV